MGRQIIDLSIAIEDGLPSDPEMMIPKIDYVDHVQGAEQMTQFFPGLKKHQLPDGLGWSLEFVRLTTHSGIHMGAGMGGQMQHLKGPSQGSGQLFFFQAREEHLHLLRALAVVEIVDPGDHHLRIAGQVRFDGYG